MFRLYFRWKKNPNSYDIIISLFVNDSNLIVYIYWFNCCRFDSICSAYRMKCEQSDRRKLETQQMLTISISLSPQEQNVKEKQWNSSRFDGFSLISRSISPLWMIYSNKKCVFWIETSRIITHSMSNMELYIKKKKYRHGTYFCKQCRIV